MSGRGVQRLALATIGMIAIACVLGACSSGTERDPEALAKSTEDFATIEILRDGLLSAMPATIVDVVGENPTMGCPSSDGFVPQDWVASQASAAYGIEADGPPREVLERARDYLSAQNTERFSGTGEVIDEITDDPARTSRVVLRVDTFNVGVSYEQGQGYALDASGPCHS